MKKHATSRIPGWKKYVASLLPGQKPRCFACNSTYCLESAPHAAVTADGKIVHVGSGCYRWIDESKGFVPSKGRPRIYKGKFARNGNLISIIAKDRDVFRAQKHLEHYRNYNHSAKGRARSKKYRDNPEVQARKRVQQRDYQQLPAVRDQRKWNQRSRRRAKRLAETKW